MRLLPAIDLIDGQCVRLHKGDFDTKKTYSVDPVSMARDFQADGAHILHLVDLDGAKDPAQRQTDLIRNIISTTGLDVQTGGGIRSLEDVETLLEIGAKRVVIGSLAVKNIELTKQAFKDFGTDNICLALDVMPDDKGNYYVAHAGWQETSEMLLDDLINEYADVGLSHVLCTDISKDGTLEGPNADLYKHMVETHTALNVQASGGIGDLDDLEKLAKLPLYGCIVGKAIYENAFSIREALAVQGMAA